MRTTISALALVVAGSSVSANSYLPSTRVRNLGIKAVHKARSNVSSNRKLQFDDMGFYVSMICEELESDEFRQEFASELEGSGMVCSKFGCDDPTNAGLVIAETPSLIMECNVDENVCQDGLNEEEFCVEDTEISMSMELDFADTSEIKATQCSTYTSPPYMEGRGCSTVGLTVDYGAMMEDITTGELDMDMTEEEASIAATEYMELTECSGEFGDGAIKCQCEMCNNGMGVSKQHAFLSDLLALSSLNCLKTIHFILCRLNTCATMT